ncbi:unnamed protein product [Protopolystoma xenopodis]|uniref:Uncharacterized protein n=1 Tax=Protopolystoma xenopodis TaxID=117903 RepID=A0A3S5AUE9_9PLAT|nr:unnamed protein product [Protopolystoma xenopodis]
MRSVRMSTRVSVPFCRLSFYRCLHCPAYRLVLASWPLGSVSLWLAFSRSHIHSLDTPTSHLKQSLLPTRDRQTDRQAEGPLMRRQSLSGWCVGGLGHDFPVRLAGWSDRCIDRFARESASLSAHRPQPAVCGASPEADCLFKPAPINNLHLP